MSITHFQSQPKLQFSQDNLNKAALSDRDRQLLKFSQDIFRLECIIRTINSNFSKLICEVLTITGIREALAPENSGPNNSILCTVYTILLKYQELVRDSKSETYYRSELMRENDTLNAENSALNTALATANAKIATLTDENAKLSNEISRISNENDELFDDHNLKIFDLNVFMHTQQHMLKKKIRRLYKKISSLNRIIYGLRNKRDELSTDLNKSYVNITSLKHELDLARAECKLFDKHKWLIPENEHLKTQLERLAIERDILVGQRDECDDQNEKLREQLEELGIENNRAHNGFRAERSLYKIIILLLVAALFLVKSNII
jgi:predicted nuclease with TOPRIM domain